MFSEMPGEYDELAETLLWVSKCTAADSINRKRMAVRAGVSNEYIGLAVDGERGERGERGGGRDAHK